MSERWLHGAKDAGSIKVDIRQEIKELFTKNIIFICFGEDLSQEELVFWMKDSDDAPFVKMTIKVGDSSEILIG